MPAKAQVTGEEASARRCCGRCLHFRNAPAAIESAFKGLSAMSSGSASVRAHDGLCDQHGLYLSYTDVCTDFLPSES